MQDLSTGCQVASQRNSDRERPEDPHTSEFHPATCSHTPCFYMCRAGRKGHIMKTGFVKTISASLLAPALLVATLPAGAQQFHRRGGYDNHGRNQQRYVAPRGYRYPVAPAYRSRVYVAPS